MARARHLGPLFVEAKRVGLPKFDTVVVSDLHLGAANSLSETFLSFLELVHTHTLVLAGDIFESATLRRMGDRELRALDAIRIFARDHHVIWLRGNHDPSLHYWRAVLGLTTREECIIDVGDNQYLVCHGQDWDPSMQLPTWLVRSSDWVYHISQRIDPSHRIARYLKRRCKIFTRAVGELESRGVAEAKQRGFAGVICGHTHFATDRHIDGIHFLNSGCWTERPCGFIGIGQGQAVQYFWDDLADEWIAETRLLEAGQSKSAAQISFANASGVDTLQPRDITKEILCPSIP